MPWVPLCLFVLYTVWGSTYLAQRVAMETLGPLQMASARFIAAGALLYGALRLAGTAAPTRRQWQAALASALPLMVTGMGTAAVGLQRVPSGLAALVFGAVPLLASCFDLLWGGRMRRSEGLGLAVGLSGVALVSLRGGLSAEPTGALLLLAAATSYAFGSVATRRLGIAPGVMGTASQMLLAGVILGGGALLREGLPALPSPRSAVALGYLTVMGSVVAYAAFGYLLRAVRPSLATSYAFVNPIVALALGHALGGEAFSPVDLAGLALVLSAVALLFVGQRSPALPRAALSSR
jgi:drug/metabolite transporter (DMT)-like permease